MGATEGLFDMYRVISGCFHRLGYCTSGQLGKDERGDIRGPPWSVHRSQGWEQTRPS